jgi:hypothetical protein
MMDYAKALYALDNAPLGLTEEGVLAIMRRPWPGMQEDVRLAKSILVKHAMAARDNGESVPLLGTLGTDGETLVIAEWIWEILDTFTKRHPGDEGSFRYRKTMFFIQDRMLPETEPGSDTHEVPWSVFDM